MFKLIRPILNISVIKQARNYTTPVIKTIKYKTKDETYVAKGKIGDSLLDVMINNDVPLDGFGACEGTLACCTCHVILSEEHFNRMDRMNPAGEEELDLLDLAPGLHDRSRLGCQIQLDESDPDEIEVEVPSIQRDARAL